MNASATRSCRAVGTAIPRWHRTLALIVALLATGCAKDSAERHRVLESAPARRLVGGWDVTLWLDRPVTLGSVPRDAARVTGTIAFVEIRSRRLAIDELTEPTHAGVYDMDLSPFDIAARNASDIPVVVASTTPVTNPASSRATTDSVTMVLDPGTSRYPFLMTGEFDGDSIVGHWAAGTLLGGGGRFALKRHATSR